jgi:hypothetical protein
VFQKDKSYDRCVSLHGGVNTESSIQVSFAMSNYKYLSPFRMSAVHQQFQAVKEGKINRPEGDIRFS